MRFYKRNIKLYFRDMPAVTMSLLAEIIIMLLYIMFIRDNLLSSFDLISDIEPILDAWMIAGILGITPVTASMGAYGIMIEDKTKYIINDFRTSPMSTTNITMGYIISAAFVSTILSIMVLLIGEGYMFLTYGNVAGGGNSIDLFVLIMLNSLCIANFVMLPVLFVKTNNALAGSCTIIGALIGFLTGIYLPMGTMGETAQAIVRNFPISHGVILFRQLLTERGIDYNSQLQENNPIDFMEYMGIVFFKDGEIISPLTNLSILIISGTICLILTIIVKVWKK